MHHHIPNHTHPHTHAYIFNSLHIFSTTTHTNPSILQNINLHSSMTNQQQQDQEPMDSSQDYNKTHQQHNTHISKKTFQENEGFIFKNSSSSLAARERNTMPPPPPPPPQYFKKTNPQHNIHVSNNINKNEGFTIKNNNCEVINQPNSFSFSSPPLLPPPDVAVAIVEESGRDRLTRHRAEMAGRVRIPDIWGHEDLLKDWIDCTVFDSSLGNNTIMSARAALVQERRSTLRIQNQC